MTYFANNEMTERAAVSKLAMLASMLICAIAVLAIGPSAFFGGAIALLLIGVSIGTISPMADDRGLFFRFAGIMLDLAIVCVLWWFCSGYLLEYSGGGLKLATVLFCSAVVNALIAFSFFALLRTSASFRRFACVNDRPVGEPCNTLESRNQAI